MNYIKADFNLDQDTVMSKYLRCAKKKGRKQNQKRLQKKAISWGKA